MPLALGCSLEPTDALEVLGEKGRRIRELTAVVQKRPTPRAFATFEVLTVTLSVTLPLRKTYSMWRL